MTNADKIRAMSDEELVELIYSDACRQQYYKTDNELCSRYNSCTDCWLDWLKQEAKGEET